VVELRLQSAAGFCVAKVRAIPHNSKCRYGERGAADAKPKAQIILDAAKVSAASGGNSEPKHDASTATRHYRAFWQRRCRAAAAGAVLKPQGGNCAVLPYENFYENLLTLTLRNRVRWNCRKGRRENQ